MESGERAMPSKVLNFKSKNCAFCALLSIDFKVCRLIAERVSDHIRKTVTNRLFSSFFQSLRDKNQEVLRQRVQAALFHTLPYRTAQENAVDLILKWKDRFKSP